MKFQTPNSECQVASRKIRQASCCAPSGVGTVPIRHLAIGNRNSAFTFTEVLFAVIILGIGFIMVAALLPVAIQQTGQGVDQGSAKSISQLALSAIATAQLSQYNGQSSCEIPPSDILPVTPAASLVAPYQSIPGKVYFFGDIYSPAGSSATASATTPPSGYPGVTFNSANYWISHYFVNNGIPDFRWNAQFNNLKGSLINPDDPRYGWVAFYQRGWSVTGGNAYYQAATSNWAYSAGTSVSVAPFLKATVIVMRSHARATYNSATDMPFNFMPCQVSGTGVPFPYYIEVYGANAVSANKPTWLTSGMPDQLQFVAPNGTNYDEPRAAEGAFVIVSDNLRAGFAEAPAAGPTPGHPENGHVFRLAAKHIQGTQTWWDLVDAYSTDYSHNQTLESTSATVHPTAYMIGRQLQDGTKIPSSTNVTGPAQDVAVFQTIIPVQQ